MKSPRLIETFNDRYPWLGSAFWVASLQYFLAQWIVAAGWHTPFSLSRNTISDLGNTLCGTYSGRPVCSPRHALMNASFGLLGTTMVLGSLLIYREFRQGRAAITGFTFMGLAGLGTILVGLFPENSLAALHTVGAALPFFIGNLGMVILGASLDLPKVLKAYTVLSGLISLAALVLLLSGHYLGLGAGGMERLTAYPQTVWLIVFGLYMGQRRFSRKSN